MKSNNILLGILALFFILLILVNYSSLFSKTEGLADENKNMIVTYLKQRVTPINPDGIKDWAIVDSVQKLGPYLDTDPTDKQIKDILDSAINTDSEKVDKLNDIFGIKKYDPLLDELFIWYDFEKITFNTSNLPTIQNKSPNKVANMDPDKFDAIVVLNGQDINSVIIPGKGGNPVDSLMEFQGDGYIQNGNQKGAYLQIPKLPTFHNPNGSFPGVTFCFWAKGNTDQHWSRIFDFGNGAGNQNIVWVNNTGHGRSMSIHCELKQNDWTQYYSHVINSVASPNDKWFHGCWKISKDGVWSLYINNLLIYQYNKGIPSNSERNFNYIGKSNWWWDGLYHGYMGDFRVYRRDLNDNEITAIYNLGLSVSTKLGPNLIPNGNFEKSFTPGVGQFIYNKSSPFINNREGYVGIHNGYFVNEFGEQNRYVDFPVSDYFTWFSAGTGYNNTDCSIHNKTLKIMDPGQYRLSFTYSLSTLGSADKSNVSLRVHFGCYIPNDTVNNVKAGKWEIYTKDFVLDEPCTDTSLDVKLIPTPGKENSGTYTLGVAAFSIRKIL